MTTQEIEALRKKYYNATLRELKEIQPGLWIFRIQPDAGIPKFKPGQYTTLGMGMWEGCVEGNAPETLRPGDEKKLLRRAYSMSHPVLNPKTGKLYTPREIDFVEFYITLVLVGGTTPTPPRLTPRLFTLKPGARLSFGPKVTGHYTIEGIQPTDSMVFFSTGTGEAPHNAMIWKLLTEGHKGPIVSCVCTRKRSDQAYRPLHEKLQTMHSNYKVIYIATREENEPKMYCQDLLTRGILEQKGNLKLNPANTHVYMCGNPSMIGRPEEKEGQKIYPKPAGLIELLEQKSFTIHTLQKHGNIHFEAYW